jgi:hypothetical protein
MGTTRLERQLRSVSDAHMDDTALEMDLLECVQDFIAGLKQALWDGIITIPEAQEVLESACRVYSLAEASYEHNVLVEELLTQFARQLRAAVAT